ncbi:hypothetical protein ACLB2K_058939 [Fragaria x ananassa]
MLDPVLDNCTNNRWKWFKNCLEALDGTYVRVRVAATDRARYRSRKADIATHVLATCSRDMQFTFVLPGWEGSTSDSRVLRDAITRLNGLRVPTSMENEDMNFEQANAAGTRRSFKSGTLLQMEKSLELLCPTSNLKAYPHIESKLKKWK